MKNVAFLTTIFPMKEEFLIDFFDSLSRQTYYKFDLIVVNDGYENFDTIKMKYKNLSIIELPYSQTPAKNREYGINYCIDNKYDILIFGDSDDYFSNNRISKSIDLLISNEIVVNDLTTFENFEIIQHKYISNRIKNNTIIDYNFIKDKNIFGMTNTAINLSILQKVKFDESLVAVDWFIFKYLLKLGHKAIFTNEIISYYRQHFGNKIGLSEVGGEYLFWWEKKSEYGIN
jgi:glycosyltransferase involved in cell wall biosynthesis